VSQIVVRKQHSSNRCDNWSEACVLVIVCVSPLPQDPSHASAVTYRTGYV